MGIWEQQKTYADLPVFRFDQGRLDADAQGFAELPSPGNAAWCVATEVSE
ncbi:hypothetical protein [Actinomadura sp. WMMB 499]|nr:hypothetical protein [Actinomadura sp. WMMB 499]